MTPLITKYYLRWISTFRNIFPPEIKPNTTSLSKKNTSNQLFLKCSTKLSTLWEHSDCNLKFNFFNTNFDLIY